MIAYMYTAYNCIMSILVLYFCLKRFQLKCVYVKILAPENVWKMFAYCEKYVV